MTDIDVRILEDRLNRLKENYTLLESFINITKEEFSKDPIDYFKKFEESIRKSLISD